MKVPENPSALLRRKATADALTEAGYPTSEKTLATQASHGNGPPHRLYGRYPIYRWGDVVAWAEARLRPSRGSTK